MDDYELDDQQDDHKFSGWNRLRGKLFSHSQESSQTGKGKQLNDDVEEFLQPCAPFKTEIIPKLNTPTAQRWPNTVAVRAAQDHAAADHFMLQDVFQVRKPRRRLGLKVGFVAEAPEIIGEGGDDADRPVMEISRMRGYVSASVRGHTANTSARTYSGLQEKPLDHAAKCTQIVDHDTAVDSHLQQHLLSAQGFVFAPQVQRGDQSPRERKTKSTSESPPPQKQRRRASTGYSYDRSPPISPVLANKPHDPYNPQMRSRILVAQQSQQQETQLLAHRYKTANQFPDRHPDNRLSEERRVVQPASRAWKELKEMGADQGRALASATRSPTPRLEEDGLQSSITTSKLGASPTHPGNIHENNEGLPNRRGALASPTLDSERPVHSSLEIQDAALQPVTQNSNYESSLRLSRGLPSPTSPSHTLPSVELKLPISKFHASLERPPLQSLPTSPLDPGHEFSARPHSSDSLAPVHPPSHLRPIDEIQATSTLLARSARRDVNVTTQNAALLEFADRVSRLSPTFRLASSVEKPLNQYSMYDLLRAALWWFLKGRNGLEDFVKVQLRNGDRTQDRSIPGQEPSALLQHYISLAKAWWLVSEARDPGSITNLPTQSNTTNRTIIVMLDSFERLVGSLARKSMMPPRDFVLEGFDTSIWIQYPNLPPHTCQILSLKVFGLESVDGNAVESNALLAMPLGDTADTFCYDRMFVDVVILTSKSSLDQSAVPCVLTIIRNRAELQLQLILASLSLLLDVTVSGNSRSLVSWDHVRWKRDDCALRVELLSKMRLQVNLKKRDYETLERHFVQTQRMISSSQPKENESLLLEDQLRGFQYWDTNNSKNFPTDYLTSCTSYLFETFAAGSEGSERRQLHQGYRLTVLMSSREKAMRSISVDLGKHAPLEYDFGVTREETHNSVIQLYVITEGRRRCLYLMFKDTEKRDTFRGCATGATVGPDEAVTLTLTLKALVFQTETGTTELAFASSPSMGQTRLQILTSSSAPADKEPQLLRYSSSVRIVILNSHGSIVDRFDLGRGELKISLDSDNQLKILRQPRKNLTIALGPNRVDHSFMQSMCRIHDMVVTSSTIQTYKFNTVHDLHAFQHSVTGFSIVFDGVASHFAISRRRMVVPIYKSYEAHRARIQIVQREGVVQLLAFFDGYSLADSMNFQLKTTDTFEKLENKAGQFCIKFVDAKFALKKEDGEESGGMFVCLDVLEYPIEHEDITVGFEIEEVRDEFAAALPAAPTVARKFTLKRRI